MTVIGIALEIETEIQLEIELESEVEMKRVAHLESRNWSVTKLWSGGLVVTHLPTQIPHVECRLHTKGDYFNLLCWYSHSSMRR